MNDNKIFILSGPIQSGKSTRLMEWAMKEKNVKGIITPIVGNNRMFYNIDKKQFFAMESAAKEIDTLKIGKYFFSQYAFRKAEKIIEDGALNNEGWLVIDEIGPLELKGEGFNTVLKKILPIENKKFNLLLVIRESILEDILKYFEIKKFCEMKI